MLTPLKIQSLATGVNLVDTPPVIVTQPESSSGFVGSTVSFTVEAIGGIPLSYQWYKDGAAIFEANESTMTISPLGVADGGVYTVQVSNSLDVATSDQATLTVLQKPFRPDALTQGLIAYWDFSESSNLGRDVSGRENNLYNAGNVVQGVGPNGWKSAEFNGGNYLAVADDPNSRLAMNSGEESMTISPLAVAWSFSFEFYRRYLQEDEQRGLRGVFYRDSEQ